MRISIVSLIVCFASLFTSGAALGQWFEAQGFAYVKKGDVQSAKTQAMQDALKKALLVAGASVSSVQQVVNGLLTQDDISIRASGVVNSLELTDEIHQADMITVTIRADIFAQQQQCFSADYRKGLLLTRSNLIHREQANVGKIYALDTVLISELAKKLRQDSRYIDSRLALKHKVPFSRYNQSIYSEELKNITLSLAAMTDSQYVLYSEIVDLSFDNEVQNGWQFWQADQFERHLALHLFIYNGANGEMIYQKQYHDLAAWTFGKRDSVDLNSQSFWHSEYGQMVDQLLANIVTDLDEQIMCEPTRGKIVQVQGNEITINLGAKQGVQIGDEFSLLHVQNFVSDSGKTYAGYNISPYKVRVFELTQETAKARTVDASLLGNIQREDFAVKH